MKNGKVTHTLYRIAPTLTHTHTHTQTPFRMENRRKVQKLNILVFIQINYLTAKRITIIYSIYNVLYAVCKNVHHFHSYTIF